MLRPQTLTLALAAISFVVADTANFTIDPTEITAGTRADWCRGEINTCRTLCGQPKANDCDPTDLSFTCTCQNGSAPGLQYYSQTMPSFVCEQAFQDCIAANVSDKKAQDACTTDIKNNCGTLDPNKASTGGDSGGSSDSPTASGTGSGGSGSPTETGSSPSSTTTGNAAPANAALLGNGAAVIAAGLFAAFL